MMTRALLVSGLLAVCSAIAACGGSDGSSLDPRVGLSPTPSGSAAPGWSLTPEELCQLITASEFSAAVGEEITARATAFDGCEYSGAMVAGRLSETVFTSQEYLDVMPQMGAAWVNEVEDGAVVLSYADDGLVIDAWFAAGAESLNLSLMTGLGESIVLAIIEAARS
jgi:hypothetical protein